MRKSTLLLVCAVLSLAAVPAFGSISFVNTSLGSNSDGGGPFTATVSGSNPFTGGNPFRTYCIEADGHVEYVSLGQQYLFDVTLEYAINTNNHVTPEAKWLFWASTHTPAALVGYNPLVMEGSERALQRAIWHGIENPDNTPLNMPFNTNVNVIEPAELWFAAAVNFINLNPAWASTTGLSIVVVNPYTMSGNTRVDAQSMLGEVPEPATMIVWSLLGVCAAGMTMWRRRPLVAREPTSDPENDRKQAAGLGYFATGAVILKLNDTLTGLLRSARQPCSLLAGHLPLPASFSPNDAFRQSGLVAIAAEMVNTIVVARLPARPTAA